MENKNIEIVVIEDEPDIFGKRSDSKDMCCGWFGGRVFNLLKYIRKNLKIIDRLDSMIQRVML